MEARAIAGTHVVTLAWDFLAPSGPRLEGLLGFAIQRTEFSPAGTVEEVMWLRGIKRFRDKDRGLAPGTPVPTNEHPIQSFQWADYTAESGVAYSYRIVPTYGIPKRLEFDDTHAITLKIETESQAGIDGTGETRHDIYFNRGVIGSQAYSRRFGNARPDEEQPHSEEMVWLSRGLFEALVAFIGHARDESYSLRAALYEFHYQPVANAFAKSVEAGANVQIVYDDASSYKIGNRAAISRAHLDENGAVIPRTVTEGIRHNKFIVLLKDDVPKAVWTGSTNISAGGIFGHSNVGHVVWNDEVARSYLDYWKLLAKNLTPTKLRPKCLALTPLPPGRPAAGVHPVFSARDAKDDPATLAWYADRMAEATRMVCITIAFNLDALFQQVIARENDVLRYIVKDDDLGDGELIGQDRDVLFAAGGYLGEGSLANFAGETSNPLNRNDYIHTKFMLIDPLGDDPLVVSGSANFSRPSQTTNDENMLVIRGDLRVADIYFGEYMRIFEHHYARYLVRKLGASNRSDPNAGYLKVDAADWTRGHFEPESYKAKRRRYFLGD